LVPRRIQLRYRAFYLIFFDNIGLLFWGSALPPTLPHIANVSVTFMMVGFTSIAEPFIFIFMSFVVFANNRLDRNNPANFNLPGIGAVYLLAMIAYWLSRRHECLMMVITQLVIGVTWVSIKVIMYHIIPKPTTSDLQMLTSLLDIEQV